RCQIARATFRNLGQHLADFSHVHRLTPQRFTTMCHIEGLEHVETLLQRGRGLLIISAHFGSWELAPAVALCLSTPLHVVVRPLDSLALQRLAERYRQCCGYHTIARRAALAECLKVLRRGEIVAVLMDQSSLRHESIQVEFFGINAYTSRGPALLLCALAVRSLAVFSFAPARGVIDSSSVRKFLCVVQGICSRILSRT